MSVPRPLKLRATEPSEAQILNSLLRFLALDRRVAWAKRMNVGASVIEGKDASGKPTRRFVRFAWPGCSDIIGQLADGRFLAVECKAAHGRLSPDQAAFLDQVNAAGGLAFVARSIEDAQKELGLYTPRK